MRILEMGCGILLLAGAVQARQAAPQKVGAGVISTPDDEVGMTLAPDGETAYFTKRSPTTNTPPRSVICLTHRHGNTWAEPEVAAFSGTYNDFGVTLKADGKRLIFSSDRPGAVATKAAADLWMVERSDSGWSEPRNLGAPINTPANEAYPSLAADGTLYFASNRAGGKGASDLYRSRWVDGHYTEPENLGDINTEGYESQPAIAPDQRFLVFVSLDRPDTLTSAGAPYSRTDLYVSFRDGEKWSAPRHLAAPISSPDNESGPSVSLDGAWLYFSSDRSFVSLPMPKRLGARAFQRQLHGIDNGWGNIYRVPSNWLDNAKGATP
jgi:Tol biopolymer transport system component